MKPALLYGSYGYTGNLIKQLAAERGISIVEAGRTASKLGEGGVSFSLDSAEDVASRLKDYAVVLNCAGPFARTAQILAKAAILAGIHYLDIAGEVPEFEAVKKLDKEAREAGVMLMPGVGFGIVPTDFALALAKKVLPESEEGALCFETVGGASRGTLESVLGGVYKMGHQRLGGSLIPERVGKRQSYFDLGAGPVLAINNPWRADLSHPHFSNLSTFTAFPGPLAGLMRQGHRLRALVESNAFKGIIRRLPAGPSEAQRKKGLTRIWAEAVGKEKHSVVRLTGPEAYDFTAYSAVFALEKVLAGEVSEGFKSPSEVWDPEALSDFPEVTIERFELPVQPDWPSGFSPSSSPVYSWNMKVMESSVEEVWQRLINAPEWPSLYSNAAAIKVLTESGQLEPDCDFSWRTFGVPVKTRVIEWEEQRLLTWIGGGLGSTGCHRWHLYPLESGCVVITDEVQRGPAVALLAPILRRGLLHYHQRWLEGLDRG